MDEATECPICFDVFDDYGKSRPTSCTHYFHSNCLKRWTRKTNTCPSCRQNITSIETIYKNKKGIEKKKTEKIQHVQQQDDNHDLLDNPDWICHICFLEEPGDEARTLICEGCEYGFHMSCLSPPLRRIPEGDWFCPQCVRLRENIEPGPDQCTYCCSSRNLGDGHRCSNCERKFHALCVPQLVQERMRNYDEWLCNYCFHLYDNAIFEALRRPPPPRQRTSASRANTVRGRRRIARRNEFIVSDSDSDSEPDQDDEEEITDETSCSDEEQWPDEGPVTDSENDGAPDFEGVDAMVLNNDTVYNGILPPVKRRTRIPKVRRMTKRRKSGRRRKSTARSRRWSRRDKGEEKDDSSSKDKSKYPIQSTRLGITSGFADIADLDVEHGEGPSSSVPSSVSTTFDLLGGILQEQEKVLAPGNLFDQRNGKFVAKEKEFEDYRNTVQTKKPVSKVRPWPSSSSKLPKSSSMSRPSSESRPRNGRNVRSEFGSNCSYLFSRIFSTKDETTSNSPPNRHNADKNADSYIRREGSVKSGLSVSSNMSASLPTDKMKNVKSETLSNNEHASSSSATSSIDGINIKREMNQNPDGYNHQNDTTTTKQKSSTSTSDEIKIRGVKTKDKKKYLSKYVKKEVIEETCDINNSKNSEGNQLGGINIRREANHDPAAFNQQNDTRMKRISSSSMDDEVKIIGMKMKDKRKEIVKSVKNEDIEGNNYSNNSKSNQGNMTMNVDSHTTTQFKQSIGINHMDTNNYNENNRQIKSESASLHVGGCNENSSISNNKTTNSSNNASESTCTIMKAVKTEVEPVMDLNGAGNMPVKVENRSESSSSKLVEQNIRPSMSCDPVPRVKVEPEDKSESMPSSSKQNPSNINNGKDVKAHKRSVHESNATTPKKSRPQQNTTKHRLDVNVIDRIAKDIFNEAYVKRKIDRVTYKAGLREVVKMSYKLHETEADIIARSYRYLDNVNN